MLVTYIGGGASFSRGPTAPLVPLLPTPMSIIMQTNKGEEGLTKWCHVTNRGVAVSCKCSSQSYRSTTALRGVHIQPCMAEDLLNVAWASCNR